MLAYTTATHDITAINLDTGAETVIVNINADVTPSLYDGTALVFDADNDRLLMTARTSVGQVSGLYGINIGAGTATLITTDVLSNNAWREIIDLTLDSVNDQVYALYNDLNASYPIRFDLGTGDGASINASSVVGIEQPRGFFVDTEARRAFVADVTLDGILVYDLDSGERALALR